MIKAAHTVALSRRFKRVRSGAVLAAALALAACAAAPPDRFYTLAGGPDAAPTPAPSAGAGKLYIELQPVGVPPQVSRNQLVVTAGAGRLEVLEQERWAAPVAAEIGQALSADLSAELGAIDIYRTPHPDTLPLYRISANVQRFESAPGQYALVDAVWSVHQLPGGTVLTCRSVANEKVGAGYDELVAGHRRAVARVAAEMSKAIRSLAAGGQGGC
ncbi:MAG TPA: PqiC family protein [Janthinobacterium sp.]|jgi:hypothetical protein|nr:PqiC family protein [Janthinobacterium sp.]